MCQPVDLKVRFAVVVLKEVREGCIWTQVPPVEVVGVQAAVSGSSSLSSSPVTKRRRIL